MTDEELSPEHEAHKKSYAKALEELEAENKKAEKIANAALIISVITIIISIISIILKLLSRTG